jgi:plasmid stabilization system protein ParE
VRLRLQSAHSWIAKENPAAAEEFSRLPQLLVDLLGSFPGMGTQTDQPGVSMFTLVRYRYLIYYKVLKLQGAEERGNSNFPGASRLAKRLN